MADLDPLVAWNLALFGKFTHRHLDPPFPGARRMTLWGYMALYDAAFAERRLPYQRREDLRRRIAVSPVIVPHVDDDGEVPEVQEVPPVAVIPVQRTYEDTPGRPLNNRGGRG